MTNEMVKKRIFNSLDDDSNNVKRLPFIPIIPLQGFSITVKTNNYNYKSCANVFYPSYMYLAKFDDNILRFTKFGYLHPMQYANKKWQNWNDLESNENNNNNNRNLSPIRDSSYVVSSIGEKGMQHFENNN